MNTPIIWTAALAQAVAAIAADPLQQLAQGHAAEIKAAPGQELQPFQGSFIQALRQRLAAGLATTAAFEAAWAAACDAAWQADDAQQPTFQVEYCEGADYWMVLDGDIVIDDCFPSRQAAEERAQALAARRQEREA